MANFPNSQNNVENNKFSKILENQFYFEWVENRPYNI